MSFVLKTIQIKQTVGITLRLLVGHHIEVCWRPAVHTTISWPFWTTYDGKKSKRCPRGRELSRFGAKYPRRLIAPRSNGVSDRDVRPPALR